MASDMARAQLKFSKASIADVVTMVGCQAGFFYFRE